MIFMLLWLISSYLNWLSCSPYFIFLVTFALEPREVCQTVMKEHIKAVDDMAFYCQQTGREAKKASDDQYYHISIINTEIAICINSFRNLFAIEKKKWRNLKESSTHGAMLHGNIGNANCSQSASHSDVQESVFFLSDLSKEHGESYATRFIHKVSGMSLCKEEEGLVEIPSFFTQQKLYAEYCFSQGYKVKANTKGSYGFISQYEPREFDEFKTNVNILVGSEQE